MVKHAGKLSIEGLQEEQMQYLIGLILLRWWRLSQP